MQHVTFQYKLAQMQIFCHVLAQIIFLAILCIGGILYEYLENASA